MHLSNFIFGDKMKLLTRDVYLDGLETKYDAKDLKSKATVSMAARYHGYVILRPLSFWGEAEAVLIGTTCFKIILSLSRRAHRPTVTVVLLYITRIVIILF